MATQTWKYKNEGLPPTRDRKGFVHKVTLLSWSLGHLWLRKEIVVDT